MKLRDKVDARCIALGISKATLAERCGCSPQALNSLINGDNPKMSTVTMRATALDGDVALLFREGLPAELLEVSK